MRCELARDFTVAKAIAWRSSIEADPPYQRAGSVWSRDRQQLFIDSLLNGYDVPKIYLHDLRGHRPTKVYAVVDGKQRLNAMWSFVADGFPLAPTFRIECPDDLGRLSGPLPGSGQRFSELHPAWRRTFLRTPLAVVLIKASSEGDIEELFSRLNNGVALTDADRRNALGGPMARLVRDVASRLGGIEGLDVDPESRRREVAVRLLAIEDARARGGFATLDLSPTGLDAFVRLGRDASPGRLASLADSLERRLVGIDRKIGVRDLDGGDPDGVASMLFGARDDGDRESAPAVPDVARAPVRAHD
jgi:uncharacterized protein DUF262